MVLRLEHLEIQIYTVKGLSSLHAPAVLSQFTHMYTALLIYLISSLPPLAKYSHDTVY